MNPIKCILIFDIGKTNKKCILYDVFYKAIFEETVQLTEIKDEDGFDCEDLEALTNWVLETKTKLCQDGRYLIKAIHYATYGASLVYLNNQYKPLTVLYNYLKPCKESTMQLFEQKHGSIENMCMETSSPNLGNLNSGIQLFGIKYEQPQIFKNIKWVLHLPQYIHFIITGELASDITSIGCHTLLWNFKTNNYHDWVIEEQFNSLFPPLKSNVGLHDSSAALIPYLNSFSEPFILISTGTWCISLNPFNHTPLTNHDLINDCLCYLSNEGKQVKASRLFLGKEYEIALNKIKERNNDEFEKEHEQLIEKMVIKQVESTKLVLGNTNVKRIFVDGGFGKNELFMKKLAKAFVGVRLFASNVPQGSAIGAALSIHAKWNTKGIPSHLFELKNF